MFLPGEFHGQRNLAGYSPWGHKESDTTEPLTHTHTRTHTHTHTLSLFLSLCYMAFPDGSVGKEYAFSARDEEDPGIKPMNHMDREAWRVTIQRAAKSWTN